MGKSVITATGGWRDEPGPIQGVVVLSDSGEEGGGLAELYRRRLNLESPVDILLAADGDFILVRTKRIVRGPDEFVKPMCIIKISTMTMTMT